MKKSINQILLNKVQEHISSNEKLVTYLMDTLSLGRESAYRRVRDQIPFTIEEIVKLCDKLNLSIDGIVGRDAKQKTLMNAPKDTFDNPQEAFVEILNIQYDTMINVYKAQKKEIIAGLNRMDSSVILGYEYMFKFYYYKWLHQLYQLPSSFNYSDVIVPEEIITAKNKLIHLYKKIRDTHCTYILDQNMYFDIIKEIQYYYKRGLISDEDLILMKEEFHDIIYNMENIVRNATNNMNNKYLCYISIFTLESSCFYISYDDKVCASITPCSLFPMQTTDLEACKALKRLLDSQKKHSILITESNEYVQAGFFKKQHEYLNMDFKDSNFTFIDEF